MEGKETRPPVPLFAFFFFLRYSAPATDGRTQSRVDWAITHPMRKPTKALSAIASAIEKPYAFYSTIPTTFHKKRGTKKSFLISRRGKKSGVLSGLLSESLALFFLFFSINVQQNVTDTHVARSVIDNCMTPGFGGRGISHQE